MYCFVRYAHMRRRDVLVSYSTPRKNPRQNKAKYTFAQTHIRLFVLRHKLFAVIDRVSELIGCNMCASVHPLCDSEYNGTKKAKSHIRDSAFTKRYKHIYEHQSTLLKGRHDTIITG